MSLLACALVTWLCRNGKWDDAGANSRAGSFLLGSYTKPEVLKIAKQHVLALASKPDSQKISFIPGALNKIRLLSLKR